MNIVEKRRKPHEFINNSNENTVDTLFLIIENQKISYTDFFERLQIVKIDEAMQKIDEGYFITDEDAEKEAESWSAGKNKDCVE